MRTCRVPAVIIAAVIGGTGLTACAATGSNPPAATSAAATSGSTAALAGTPGASPTAALTGTAGSSSTPATSPTRMAAEPSASATASAHSNSSPHATTSPANTGSGADDFTVPAISGDNVVTAYGSYTKIGTARVKVTMCAKQTGAAFSVGAVALVYNASGASQNIGATILTGPGNSSCVSNTFIFFTAHLKVHAFIGGSNGTIERTGPVLTIY